MSKRDWAKLDVKFWSNRKVKRLTRKYGPVPAAYFFLLVAMAQESSHVEDNPAGEVHCTVQDLMDAYCDRHDRTKMLQQMCEAKLIRITGRGWQDDPEADVTIHLGDSSWITPKGSSAHRMRNKREKDAVLQVSVTGCDASVTGSDVYVTQTRQDKTIPSKLAAQPELIRAVDFLVSCHPSIERTREGLLQQLTEFCFGDHRPTPQHVLDAALEVGPSIQYPGKAYRLVAARAKSLQQNEPVLSEAPKYVPPPGAAEFHAMLAEDEAEIGGAA